MRGLVALFEALDLKAHKQQQQQQQQSGGAAARQGARSSDQLKHIQGTVILHINFAVKQVSHPHRVNY
jgi:hypothetical protein